MTDSARADAKRTPLYEEHVAAGARMIEFAGFPCPWSTAALSPSTQTVRSAAGLFDLSHMGEISVSRARGGRSSWTGPSPTTRPT